MEMYRLKTNQQAAELAFLLVEGLPAVWNEVWLCHTPPLHPNPVTTHTRRLLLPSLFTLCQRRHHNGINYSINSLSSYTWRHQAITHTHTHQHVVSAAAVRPTPMIPEDGGDVICSSQCGPVINGISGAKFGLVGKVTQCRTTCVCTHGRVYGLSGPANLGEPR